QVLAHKGYNGALADIWSCGVILYVLIAGYLPFDEIDLTTLYGKIENAEFSSPSWFPMGARSLIRRILDPNPETRIRIDEIRNDEWFSRNYTPVKVPEVVDIDFDDVNAAFDDVEDTPIEQGVDHNTGPEPLALNAFDLIILSQGLNLAALFDRRQDASRRHTRFVSQRPANAVLSSMEVVVQSMGFKTHIRSYKMRVEGLSANKTAHFSVIIEIFQISANFIMVDVQNGTGDCDEYLKFYQNLCSKLDDIIWKPRDETPKSRGLKNRRK
ncbi:hypothetical protein M569_03857, partial [Genlisea aurea]